MLTAERLRELVHYDPETGVLRWSEICGHRRGGMVLGTKAKTGYLVGRISQRLYLAHRLAWLYVHGQWPNGEVDHINGDRSDNRIANLREATRGLNAQNLRQGRGPSGRLGVCWKERYQKWHAQICAGGKNFHLGYFESIEDAHQAYLTAKRKLHEGCTI